MNRMREVWAVDFDGTLCRNAWPDIGEPNTPLIEQLKLARQSGVALILWTCREGEAQDRAVLWCAGFGLFFDAVNRNVPERIATYGLTHERSALMSTSTTGPRLPTCHGEGRRVDDVKDYLASVRWIHARVLRLQRKVQSLEAQVCRITPSYSCVPGGGGSDPSAPWVALAQLRSDYHQELVELEYQEKEVSDFINSLATPEHREVLYLRYCERLRWPDVAETMRKLGYYYSDRQVYRIHGRALNEAREKWKEIKHGRDDNAGGDS